MGREMSIGHIGKPTETARNNVKKAELQVRSLLSWHNPLQWKNNDTKFKFSTKYATKIHIISHMCTEYHRFDKDIIPLLNLPAYRRVYSRACRSLPSTTSKLNETKYSIFYWIMVIFTSPSAGVRNVAISVSVCMSVCPSVLISQKPNVVTWQNFPCMRNVAISLSFL